MKKVIYFLLTILALALLESTIIPFQLVVLAVVSWVIIRLPKEGFTGAFLAGIILDLTWETNHLGLSSLAFLIVAASLNLYKGKFKIRFIYLWPIAFLSLLFPQFLRQEFFISASLATNAFLIFLFWPLAHLLFRKDRESTLQLPLKI